MKIIQVNCVSYGSTGRIASDIHKKLLSLGHESYFAFGMGKSEVENTIRISNWFDNRLHIRLSNFTGLHGLFSVIATIRFIKKLKKINPDIIHLHNMHGYYINVPILFAYLIKNNIKAVWTLHDCWPFTGKCPHYVAVNCEKWKVQCFECDQKHSYPYSKFFDTSKVLYNLKKYMFTKVNDLKLITVSDWLKKQAEQSFLSDFPINRIYNGIDINTFFYRDDFNDIKDKHRIPYDKKIILGVASSWDKRKGLKVFIELSEKVNENEIIVLVGLNKHQIEELPCNIIGISRTDDAHELAMLYSCADVLVNPSIEETFGMVTAEAISCGTFVIVANSTACPEVISSETGIAVDTFDANVLIQIIRKIFERTKETKRFHEYIEKYFSRDRMVEDYIGSYYNFQ